MIATEIELPEALFCRLQTFLEHHPSESLNSFCTRALEAYETSLHPACVPNLPSADLTQLAFYALDSALEPKGVYLDINTQFLESEIEQLETLPAADRFQMGLTLLQHTQTPC